ncbi:hypothetical protein Q8A67_022256 [Cirrhinus molitorella]|uniref:Uncharacterized protein n=1 Tax=Cirrhinus molitorella TaxID=172907 RepID=A0AA88TF12_9TELE|nr:hypothetical protein Q8A67_022256 [Cirrhinus molitorella]
MRPPPSCWTMQRAQMMSERESTYVSAVTATVWRKKGGGREKKKGERRVKKKSYQRQEGLRAEHECDKPHPFSSKPRPHLTVLDVYVEQSEALQHPVLPSMPLWE